ncbi:conjugative transposon protein TraF [Prevotella intermedia ZT]|uniref:Conjugative transposon protein TraF n=2 Tax=Bacteroidales TaxID=171549 RepID=A0AAP0V1D2_PREIN|nr:conjugative transposon protein TraF [Prevotella intermedia ZT]
MKRSALHSHPRYLINRRRIPYLLRHKELPRRKRRENKRMDEGKEDKE